MELGSIIPYVLCTLEKNPLADIPLNPDWFIVYRDPYVDLWNNVHTIIGSFPSPTCISNNQPGFWTLLMWTLFFAGGVFAMGNLQTLTKHQNTKH